MQKNNLLIFTLLLISTTVQAVDDEACIKQLSQKPERGIERNKDLVAQLPISGLIAEVREEPNNVLLVFSDQRSLRNFISTQLVEKIQPPTGWKQVGNVIMSTPPEVHNDKEKNYDESDTENVRTTDISEAELKSLLSKEVFIVFAITLDHHNRNSYRNKLEVPPEVVSILKGHGVNANKQIIRPELGEEEEKYFSPPALYALKGTVHEVGLRIVGGVISVSFDSPLGQPFNDWNRHRDYELGLAFDIGVDDVKYSLQAVYVKP